MVQIISVWKKLKHISKKSSNLKNENFHSYEFISIKKVFEELNRNNFISSKNNSWTKLFDSNHVQINKINFLYNSKYNKKFLVEKNNGISINDLKKAKIINGSIFAKLKNVKVIKDSLLILGSRNLAFVEGYGDERWADFQINKWPDTHNFPLCKINFLNGKVTEKRIKIYRPNSKLKLINKPVIYLSLRDDDQVFHWTFENLTRLYFIDIFPNLKKIPLVSKNPLSNFQKETLNILGIKNKILITGEKDLLCKNLYFPSIPSPPVLNKKLILWLRKKFLNGIKKIKNKKDFSKLVFISRGDTSHRNILNEEQLFSELKKINFKKYELSKLKLHDQINLFQNAKIIIMPHGAGGIHTLFASKKCKIIEIQSPNQPNNIFLCVAQMLKIDFFVAMGEKPTKDHKKNYYIDIKKFIKILKKKIINQDK